MPAASAMSSIVVLRTPCRTKQAYAASSTFCSRRSAVVVDILTIIAQIVSLSGPPPGPGPPPESGGETEPGQDRPEQDHQQDRPLGHPDRPAAADERQR